MKTYTQTLTFRRQVTIKAKNAAEANFQLGVLIEEVEFAGEVDCDGWYRDFEDPKDETENDG